MKINNRTIISILLALACVFMSGPTQAKNAGRLPPKEFFNPFEPGRFLRPNSELQLSSIRALLRPSPVAWQQPADTVVYGPPAPQRPVYSPSATAQPVDATGQSTAADSTAEAVSPSASPEPSPGAAAQVIPDVRQDIRIPYRPAIRSPFRPAGF